MKWFHGLWVLNFQKNIGSICHSRWYRYLVWLMDYVAGIRLQFCTPAVLYIRVFCIMLDSNIRANSSRRYILRFTTQITPPCSPCPDAAATRV